MKIAFYSNQLGERGTETALIDYALANQQYSNNISVFCFPENKIIDKERFNLLKKDFTIILFNGTDDLRHQLKENNIDLLYAIQPGKTKDIVDELPEFKTFVHCVFTTQRKHGTYYCAIHPYLNKYFHTKYPVLPHIVRKLPDIEDNFREELQIPDNASVFGYYGGSTNFNISFVQEVVKQIAENYNNIYFLYMNIKPFISDKCKNIIFLPGSTNLIIKKKFINTCTAMLHARKDGETFGLSVAEFSISNKPVITYSPPFLFRLKEFINSFRGRMPVYSTAHLMNLEKKAITYTNKKELKKILINFSKYYKQNMNYDCFSQKFSSENVIKTFFKIIETEN